MKNLLFFTTIMLVANLLFAQIINIPADYPTIQMGIDTASNGDTVLVAPGIYLENINFNGKNITVASHYLITDDISYIFLTNIDGGALNHVVAFENGEDSTALLTGFTIIHGVAVSGGGIYCDSAGPVLSGLIISDNQATGGSGGGVFFENCNAVLKNSTLNNNHASYNKNSNDKSRTSNSSSYFMGGGIFCSNSTVLLENLTVMGNGASDLGGGISCDYSTVSLENSTVMDNGAGYLGGGIYSYESTVLLENSTVMDNVAIHGGGISCDYSTVSLENLTVMGNDVHGDGGGICCDYSTVLLKNSTVKGNVANDFGGGIHSYESTVLLENLTVRDNVASYHGGISLGSGNLILKNVSVTNNHGDYKSGIYCKADTAIFRNVLISGNESDRWLNSALYLNIVDYCDLTNITVVNNTGRGIIIAKGMVTLNNSIVHGNTSGQIVNMETGTLTVKYSNIEGGEEGIDTGITATTNWLEGNMDEDPVFVNSGEHPYQLNDLSPCIDMGNPDTTGLNLPEYDLAGEIRILNFRKFNKALN